MPSVLFLCPHCSKHGELQVTSVTRSRPCPHCGEAVLLQLGTRQGKLKSLLVANSDAPEPARAAPVVEAQSLEGDPLERMRMDREVSTFKRRFILGVLVTLGCIVAAVIGDQWFRHDVGSQQASGEAIALRSQTAREAIPYEIPPLGAKDQVDAVARQFLGAFTVEDVLAVVADLERWEEAIRRRIRLRPLKPLPVVRTVVSETGAEYGSAYVVSAELLDGSRATVYVLWRNGRALIDWPSCVGWSATSLAAFVRDRPVGESVFRVIVTKDSLYTPPFADRESLICLKLEDPLGASAQPLYGYAQKGTLAGQVIDSMLKQNAGQPLKLMLALKFPSDPTVSNQVWVERLVSGSWIEPQMAAN